MVHGARGPSDECMEVVLGSTTVRRTVFDSMNMIHNIEEGM